MDPWGYLAKPMQRETLLGCEAPVWWGIVPNAPSNFGLGSNPSTLSLTDVSLSLTAIQSRRTYCCPSITRDRLYTTSCHGVMFGCL